MGNDFDFLVGSWSVEHHRLRHRLAGSDDWEDFTGPARCWSVFGGAGNVDEFTFPGGVSGMTVRLYDPARDAWTLHWADSRTGLSPASVAGRFEAGRGVFLGDDEHGGRPIRVRYVWSDLTPVSCRWEQAFSPDGERTWETNWVMRLTREARPA